MVKRLDMSSIPFSFGTQLTSLYQSLNQRLYTRIHNASDFAY